MVKKSWCAAGLVLLSGCNFLSEFERTALDAQWKIRYVEHTPRLDEWEPISAAKNWEGDCSNFAAYIAQEHPQAKLYWGQIKDGRNHVIVCETSAQEVCADTIHRGVFKNYKDLWKVQPIEIEI